MISIAMTTYNGEAYIEEQLRSLLAQTVLPGEIVICDDCSTDRTVELLCRVCEESMARSAGQGEDTEEVNERKLQGRLENPYPTTTYVKNDGTLTVHIVQNPQNLGYIRNFYRAISLTQGDYICLCDQDDIWYPNKIERTLATLLETGVAAVCTGCAFIDREGNRIEDKNSYRVNPLVKKLGQANGKIVPITFHRLIYGNIAQGCTYCFTGKVRDNYLALHSDLLIHDHQIMFLASLMDGVVYLHEELMDYRIHEKNALGFAKAVGAKQLEVDTKEESVVNETTMTSGAEQFASGGKSSIISPAAHRPSRKPFMVQFMEQLQRIVKVPHAGYYKFLYYLRIPYIGSKLRGF